MAQRRVRGPDGVMHVFPADATDDEIRAALDGGSAKSAAAPPAAPAHWWDRLLNNVAESADPKFLADVAAGEAQGNKDIVTGLGKGAANTAIGAGQLVNDYTPVGRVNKAIYGDLPPNVFQAARAEFATPTNDAQKLGFVTEQIGENFTASGAGEKLAARLVDQLVTRGVPKAVASAAAGAAVNASVNAGTTAVQGGDVKTAAEIGAAVPVAGSLIGATGRAVGRQAPKLVRSALKPTVTAMKQTAGASQAGIEAQAERLTKFVLEHEITSAAQAEKIIADAEQEIQTALAANPKAVTDAPQRAERYLDALKRSAARQGLPADDVATITAKARELLYESPLSEDVVSTVMKDSPSGLVDASGKPVQVPVEETTRALRADVKPPEALDIARKSSQWGNRKQWGEQKGAATEASKTVERATRDSVKSAVPETAPLFQRQGNAIQAKNVFQRMEFRQGNREPISPFDVVTAATEVAGGRLPVMAVARHFLWNNKLRLGIWAKRLEQAIEDKDTQEVAGIMARFGAAGAEASVPAAAQ